MKKPEKNPGQGNGNEFYEELLVASVRETKRLSGKVDALMDSLQEAADEIGEEKNNDLLKAVAESNVLILEKLKDLKKHDEETLKRFDDVKGRLEALVDEEKARAAKELKDVEAGLEHLESELQELKAGRESLAGVQRQFLKVVEKLEALTSKAGLEKSSALASQAQRLEERAESMEKELTLEARKAEGELSASVKEVASEISAARERVKFKESATPQEVIALRLELDDLNRQVSQLFVKATRLSRPEAFDREIDSLSREMTSLQSLVNSLEARSVQAKKLATPVEKKVMAHAEIVAEKTRPEVHEAHAAKVEALKEHLAGAEEKTSNLDKAGVKEAGKEFKQAVKDLEKISSDLKKGKADEDEAHEVLKMVSERVKQALREHPLAQVEEHVYGIEEHAEALEGAKTLDLEDLKMINLAAEEVRERLPMSVVIIAGETRPGMAIKHTDEELNLSGERMAAAAKEASEEKVMALIEEHREAVREAPQRIQGLVKRIEGVAQEHSELEKETEKASKLVQKLEGHEHPLVAAKASEIRMAVESLPSAKDLTQRLETARESIETVKPAESIPLLKSMEVRPDTGKASARVREYVETLAQAGPQSGKTYDLKNLCNTLGLDYSALAGDLPGLLKGLGDAYQLKNADMLSKFQGKNIMIERK